MEPEKVALDRPKQSALVTSTPILPFTHFKENFYHFWLQFHARQSNVTKQETIVAGLQEQHVSLSFPTIVFFFTCQIYNSLEILVTYPLHSSP